MPTVTLKDCDVLQVESRSYTGKDGQARQARSVLARYGGKIFMFNVSKDADFVKIEALSGKKSSLTLQMTTFGKELDPDFAVLSA